MQIIQFPATLFEHYTDFDKITKTLFDGKDKGMIDLIAAIEKKYGE